MRPFLLKAIISFVILAFSLPAFSVSAGDQNQSSLPSTYVRVEARSLPALENLNIKPLERIEYGAYVWLALSAADLDALRQSDGLAYSIQSDAGVISVMGYRFDPIKDGEPGFGPVERILPSSPGLRLVQFSGPVKDVWLEKLKSSGADVLQYYPNNTYLVWSTGGQAERFESESWVRWRGDFHPAYRLSPALDGTVGWVENIAVTFYNSGDPEKIVREIESVGAKTKALFVAQPDGRFQTAVFSIDAAALERLTQVPEVWAVEYISPEPGLDDEVGAQIVAGNLSSGVPQAGYHAWLSEIGLDGSGITWADVDTGLDGNHPDITGRVNAYVTYPGAPLANTDPDGHGSHTAGAIFGNPLLSEGGTGITDPNGFYWGMGVAPGADLIIQNVLSGTSWPPSGGWQQLSKDSVTNGAIGSSNSWFTGASGSQGYSSAARTHDLIVRDANFDTATVAEPIILVFSAGNACGSSSCPSTITEPKEAKNVIVVGASANYPRAMASVNDIAYFSSRGPAQDGRILPNVMAPGHTTVSFKSASGAASCTTSVSGPGSSYYSYCSGTSMAAPQVSGAGALIAEWWSNQGRGTPSPAMAKALLINSADDMAGGDNGWSVANTSIPNNEQGWGRVNLSNLLDASAPAVYYDQTQLFQNTGETWQVNLNVVDPTQPLKITLVWTDAPGAVGANPALVNNLDLEVTNGGATYKGNRFSAGWSVSGGSADILNNIENVYVQNPSTTVGITIVASAISGDGVPYNGDATDQDFALVCSNCADIADFTVIATPTTQAVCTPSQATYGVEVGQLIGFNDPVTLSAAVNPAAGFSASFSTNPVTPPGSSVLTIGNTVSAVAGTYSIDVFGIAPTSTHSTTVSLDLSTSIPGAADLLAPVNGTVDLPLRPNFAWTELSQAASYTIEIATDSGFTDIVDSASGLPGPSYTPGTDLDSGQQYFWRVRAGNICGSGEYSSTFSFITELAPGQCAIGDISTSIYSEDFEGGALGWSSSGAGNTWALSGARVHSGSAAFYAVNPASVSDQRLVSPMISLPNNTSDLVLSFWNYQSMESRSGGCYDGGILEISTDGANWTQLEAPVLLSDPYDGPISSSFNNPLGGRNAWCGEPQDWLESFVSLNAYAGQSVQFRFRLGSDTSLGEEGWYIDDLSVQGCQPPYAASLSSDSSLSGVPGSSVIHTFLLQNNGLDDSYTLAVNEAGWPTRILSSNPIQVSTDSAVTISVEVDIPLLPLVGDLANLGKDAFTLTATSVASPSLVMSASGTTTAAVHPGVNLTPEYFSRAGEPGNTVEFEFNLVNSGDYTDTIDLSLSGWSWPTSMLADQFTLAPGTGAAFTVGVNIPVNPATDAVIASDHFTLTATSGLDSLIEAQALGTTNANVAPGVEVSPGISSLSGLPGEIVTHTFRITNTGTYTDNFTLQLSENIWAVSAPQASSPLEPGKAIEIDVIVEIPHLPLAESELMVDNFKLSLVSEWDSLVHKNVNGSTAAVINTGLAIGVSPDQAIGFPGRTVTYTLVLTNTGEYTDTFSLQVSGGWPASLVPSSGPLGVGDAYTANLVVGVPHWVPPGASEPLTLVAASGIDPLTQESVQITAQAVAERRYFPQVFHK